MLLSTIIPQVYGSFDDGWFPDRYLAQYYSAVENDERVTLSFLTQAAAVIGPVTTLLEFGCGPTVHHLFPFAARTDEIHVADYVPSNLAALRRWIDRRDGAHDWSEFATFTLTRELGRAPSGDEVATREQLTRQRITRSVLADARRARPIEDRRAREAYPAVLCCFCPDSITDDLPVWKRCMRNIASLVAVDGWLVLAALGATDGYHVGDTRFPSPGVTEQDVAMVLAEAGFAGPQTTVTVAAVSDERRYGFSSVILAMARRAWN